MKTLLLMAALILAAQTANASTLMDDLSNDRMGTQEMLHNMMERNDRAREQQEQQRRMDDIERQQQDIERKQEQIERQQRGW